MEQIFTIYTRKQIYADNYFYCIYHSIFRNCISNSNKKSDFSYSGHTFEWFEDDTNKSVLALLSFILGVSVIGICILHIITH